MEHPGAYVHGRRRDGASGSLAVRKRATFGYVPDRGGNDVVTRGHIYGNTVRFFKYCTVQKIIFLPRARRISRMRFSHDSRFIDLINDIE